MDYIMSKRRISWRNRIVYDTVESVCRLIYNRFPASDKMAIGEILAQTGFALFPDGMDYVGWSTQPHGSTTIQFCIDAGFRGCIKAEFDVREKYTRSDICTGLAWADDRLEQYLKLAGMYEERENEQGMG